MVSLAAASHIMMSFSFRLTCLCPVAFSLLPIQTYDLKKNSSIFQTQNSWLESRQDAMDISLTHDVLLYVYVDQQIAQLYELMQAIKDRDSAGDKEGVGEAPEAPKA